MPMPPDDAASPHLTAALREMLLELTRLRREELTLLETLSQMIDANVAPASDPLPLSDMDHFDFATIPERPAPPDLTSTAYTALQPLAGLGAEPDTDTDEEAQADAIWLEMQADLAADQEPDTEEAPQQRTS